MSNADRTISSVVTGIIAGIENCGTIIIVRLRTEEGWVTPVFFDHRPFKAMLDAEGCDAGKLVGRRATFDGETFSFLD